MAQWDVHRTSTGALALDIQSDLLSGIRTKIVVPLVTAADMPAVGAKLAPPIIVGDLNLHAYVLAMTALPVTELGPVISNAGHARDAITRALDMVLSGV